MATLYNQTLKPIAEASIQLCIRPIKESTFMDKETHSLWRMPSPETLPEADATLKQIIHFAYLVDPTAHFHDRWGEKYTMNVHALWQSCVESFKAGAVAVAPPDELLMCLTYDVVLGPYLGVPEPHKLPFLQWLLDGVRKSL